MTSVLGFGKVLTKYDSNTYTTSSAEITHAKTQKITIRMAHG